MSKRSSWYDPRITKNCSKVLADSEIDWSDVCTIFWKPTWTYPTALGDVTVVEDYGTAYYVGADSKSTNQATPGLSRSFGRTMQRLRVNFLTIMKYFRYPYDTQTFEFDILSSFSANEVIFHSVAIQSINDNAKHQVWDVLSFSSSDDLVLNPPGVNAEAAKNAYAAATFESPAYNYARHQVLADGFDDSKVSGRRALSNSKFQINVRRYCGYYLGNYVVLESVLVFLGWITFFMDPGGVDSRLGIALTLVLAINVFQIVLVENLPETGYLTDLSLFTICNTVLLSLIAIETIIVGEAYKIVKKQEEMIRLCKEHINRSKSIAAANCIQRKVRLRQVRKLSHIRTPRAESYELNKAVDVSVDKKSSGVRHRRDEEAPATPIADRRDGLATFEAMNHQRFISEERHRRSACPSAAALVCRMLCLPCHILSMCKLFRVKYSRWINENSRFFAYETDRLSAFIIFPSLYLTYFCAIFLRAGGGFGNCSPRPRA